LGRTNEPTPRQIEISEELKNEGNVLFRKGKFIAAAEKYTEAIAMRPRWTVALVNRANCYKKLERWSDVERDCRGAIEVDKQSMKGHYFLGLALEARNDHASALIHLEKSYELARDKEDQIMDEIWKVIARVSYGQWEREARQRSEKDAVLMSRLQSLLHEAHVREMRAAGHPANLAHIHAEEKASLMDLFKRATAPDRPIEIPGCLTCVLTMDVFRDPVLSPSGFSYEYADLKRHIDRVGHFDPVTRQPIEKTQLVRNLNLRSVSHLYLKEHPWAWKESM